MILISVAVITLQWLAYLAVMHAKPAWVLSMLGPNLGLGIRANDLVLGHRYPKIRAMADGADRPLVDTLGQAVEKTVGRLN